MKSILSEVNHNYISFTKNWKDALKTSIDSDDKDTSSHEESYMMLVSLEAWRCEVLSKQVDKDVINFFIEAQNDALLSHVFARLGCYRPALQALRSVVENIMFCLYYKDHRVEFLQWEKGCHRLSFQDLIVYFLNHPATMPLKSAKDWIASLKKEYAMLSYAVHGSSIDFRMTKDNFPNLFNSEKSLSPKWFSRQKNTISCVNFLILSLFHKELQGANNLLLRKLISYCFSVKNKESIKKEYAVNLLFQP